MAEPREGQAVAPPSPADLPPLAPVLGASAASYLLAYGLGLVAFALTTRALGAAGYVPLAAAAAVVGLVALGRDVGVSDRLLGEVASDPSALRRAWSLGLAAKLLVFPLLAAVTLAACLALRLGGEATLLALVLTVALGVASVGQLADALLVACHQAARPAQALVASNAAILGVTFLLVAGHSGALGFAAVTVLGNGVALAVVLAFLRRRMPLRPTPVPWRQVDGLFRRGAGLAAGAFLQGVTWAVPVLAVAASFGAVQAGAFSGAFRLGIIALAVLGWLSRVLYGRFSHLEARQQERGRERLLLRSVAGWALALPVAVSLGRLASPAAADLVLGPGYEAAAPVLAWLAALLPLHGLSSALGWHANSTGRTRAWVAATAVSCAVAAAGVTLACVQGWLAGAAAALVAGEAAAAVVLLLADRQAAQTLWHGRRRGAAAALAASTVLAAACAALPWWASLAALAATLAALVASGLLGREALRQARDALQGALRPRRLA